MQFSKTTYLDSVIEYYQRKDDSVGEISLIKFLCFFGGENKHEKCIYRLKKLRRIKVDS